MAEHFEDPFDKNEGEPKVSFDANGNALSNASLGKRFVNVLVDGFAIGAIGALLSMNTGSFFWGNLIYFAYYIYLENSKGQTLGKMLTKTKVVNQDGSKPELAMIILRTLLRFIPILWISFLITDDKTGWHDRWTKTRVVEI